MSEQQQEVTAPGPGEILRKAREAANLTTDQIADKLHLKSALVVDLENDNYDINISVTFIKGYLKLYAKHVDVPESIIVDAFENLNTQKKEPAKLQSFSRRFSHQANDDKLMLVTYLIIAVVIALAVAWWFQQSNGDSFLSSSSTSSTVASPVSETLSSVSQSQNSEIGERQQGPIQTIIEPTSDESPVGQEPDNTLYNASEAADQVENNPSVATPEEEATQVSEDALLAQQLKPEAATVSLAQQPVVVDENTELQTVAKRVELVFEFADNCWMNLADATGENIAYGVKVKGRVMPVTGIPPFVVTLGAPEVVQIKYAGEPVDMSFITPGRSAKFTLPLTVTTQSQ